MCSDHSLYSTVLVCFALTVCFQSLLGLFDDLLNGNNFFELDSSWFRYRSMANQGVDHLVVSSYALDC